LNLLVCGALRKCLVIGCLKFGYLELANSATLRKFTIDSTFVQLYETWINKHWPHYTWTSLPSPVILICVVMKPPPYTCSPQMRCMTGGDWWRLMRIWQQWKDTDLIYSLLFVLPAPIWLVLWLMLIHSACVCCWLIEPTQNLKHGLSIELLSNPHWKVTTLDTYGWLEGPGGILV
jgi:hypothetical protein